MDVKQVKFTDGEIVRNVLLYKGIPVEELSKILGSVFGLNGTVIGFLAEDGTVLPISLSCQMPDVFYTGIYQVLTTTENVQYLTTSVPLPLPPSINAPLLLPPSTTSTSSSVNVSTPPVAPLMPPRIPLTRPPERRESRASAARNAEIALTEEAMDQLLRFISGLRVRALVTKDEAKSLEELLFEDDTLLLAAYAVATSANDAEYLAEIIIDVAQSLKTESGRAALSAQEDMLHVCDSLYEVNKISDKQLLFLRHLILIREDVVATIYDDFQGHQSVDIMAKELHEVAYSNSNLLEYTADYDDDDNDEQEQSLGQRQEHDARPVAPSPMSSTLNTLIAVMLRTSQLSASEGAILLEMINDENEYIIAAYELYEQDGDEEEMKDTLMRCAKLEVRKRILASHEEGLSPTRRQQVGMQQEERGDDADVPKDEAKSDVEYEDDFEDDDNNNTNISESRDGNDDYTGADDEADETADDDEDEGDDDDDDDEEEDGGDGGDGVPEDEDDEDVPLANAFSEQLGRHLEDLLSVVGVENIWTASVPQQFIFTVFAAAHKSLMSVHQAKALCDLFQAHYDLVRAAWEVYSVQGDVRDFTDTLLRIVRDLEFDRQGNLTQNSMSQVLRPAAAGGGEGTSSSQETITMKAQQKKQAKEAVEHAKRDLLKHSLEMMIKQDMTSPENAAKLFEQSLNGDVLVDAAIEAYANNRDVSDFLDTLQILANHSRQELDAALRRAVVNDTEITQTQTNPMIDVNTLTTNLSIEPNLSPSKASPANPMMMSPARSTVTASVSSPGAMSANRGIDSSGPRSPGAAAMANTDPTHRPSPAPSPLTRTSAPGFPPVTGVRVSGNLSPSQREEATAYAELRDVVTMLTADNVIDYDTRVTLLRLIASRDDRLIAAYAAYRDQNREDLVAALIRVAQREQHNSPKKSPVIPDKAYDEVEEDEDDDVEDEDEEEEGDDDEKEDADEGEAVTPVGLLNSVDQRNILDILVRAGAIPREAVAALYALISRSDPRVQHIFLQYEQDKDVYRLIEALKAIQEQDEEEDEEEGEEEADDDDGGEENDDDDTDDDGDDDDDDVGTEQTRKSMDERFMSIVKNMNMSHLETAALRLAIARDDGAIRTALEDFRVTVDEPSLINTLRSIARKTIEDTMMEADMENDDEDDDEEDEEEEEEGEELDNTGATDDGVGDAETISLRSSDDRLMSTQSARDHVFPILINELVKEDIMQDADGLRVLQQFAAGNAVVSAALDIYDLDSDMAELVDTLLRVAKACEGQ